MGSWNGTCAVSHMPITHGQKVKAYILVPHYYHDVKPGAATPGTGFELEDIEKFSGGGICYSTDAWSPLSIPIDAEYNDYGGIDSIKVNQNTNYILEWVNKETGKGFKSLEEMFDAISQGETVFAFMLVHPSIYNAAVDAVEESRDEEYDGDRLLINIMLDFEAAREYARTEGATDSLMEGLHALGIKSAEPDPHDVMMRTYVTRQWPKREGAHRSAVEAYSGMGSRDGMMQSDFSREYFNKMIKSESTSIEDLVNHYQFCCFMSSARRTWIAQAGCGSQCDEYKIHRLVAEATLAHLAEVKKQHADDTDLSHPAELAHHNKRF